MPPARSSVSLDALDRTRLPGAARPWSLPGCRRIQKRAGHSCDGASVSRDYLHASRVHARAANSCGREGEGDPVSLRLKFASQCISSARVRDTCPAR
eukprot:350706-Chlamydomonas_euryale.AAC.1